MIKQKLCFAGFILIFIGVKVDHAQSLISEQEFLLPNVWMIGIFVSKSWQITEFYLFIKCHHEVLFCYFQPVLFALMGTIVISQRTRKLVWDVIWNCSHYKNTYFNDSFAKFQMLIWLPLAMTMWLVYYWYYSQYGYLDPLLYGANLYIFGHCYNAPKTCNCEW